MRMCHFRAQNDPLVLKKIFFGTYHYYYFHLPTGPFHCAKIEKNNLTAVPKLGCAIFGPKMVHWYQTKTFLENIINILNASVALIKKPVKWFEHLHLRG